MNYGFNIKGVARFTQAVRVAPEVLQAANLQAMELSVRVVEGDAKGRVPRRTGRLFSSIGTKVETKGAGWIQGTVGTSVKYGPFVELGTQAHEIAPLTAMALVFPIGGHNVYASRVHHPGARAHAYLAPALETSRTAILGFFRGAAQRLVAHLGATGG